MRAFTAVVKPGAAVPVLQELQAAGASVEVEHTRGLDHARSLTLAAAERGRVVLAVGGDGMAGCVGGALAGSGAPFGIVPAGRGNDFVRALGGAPDAARLLSAEPRTVDAIELSSAVHDQMAVLGSVYAGVDAAANRNANASRVLRGAASYYVGALRAVLTWRPVDYRITIDGELLETRGYTVVAANSGYYGFGRRIAPSAELDDGLLDIVIIGDAPRPAFFAVMNELKSGAHVRRPQVSVRRGREVRIEAAAPVPYGADGEVDGALPVTARVLPGALRIIA